MKLRQLEDLNMEDKAVFVRLDLNVPLKDGKITDDTRILKALPTLEYIFSKTSKVVVASHLGRPKGEVVPEMSLAPVGERLAELLGREAVLASNYSEEPIDQLLPNLDKKQFVLLENLRFNKGETKNDSDFVHVLAKGIDLYVNDAFGTSHRAHASTVGLAEKFSPEKRAAGHLIQKEVSELGSLLEISERPFSVVMGGSKVSDKIGIILSLIDRCNHLIIGGAMAYTFLKFKGFDVGASMVEEDKMDLVEMIYRTAERRKVSIHLPVDHVCAKEFKEDAEAVMISDASIPDGLMGLDIGPKSILNFKRVLQDSKTILWNGPMGVFEWDDFSKGSFAIAEEMAASHGRTVIGGGDSVAACNKVGVGAKMTHVSTGGGASLEFLEGKTLPGLKVLFA